jgi:hypothetical protein
MFKIVMILCVAGASCMPMYETNRQTYTTEKACWQVLTQKMDMLDQLGEEPDFQSLSAACIKAE